MDSKLKQEAIEYFGKKALQRLFSLFKNKIESLGNVSGSVKIKPTEEERAAIEAWMGTKIKASPVTINLTKFERRLIGSKFESFNLLEIIEWVTKEPIAPKKNRQLEEQQKKEAYFQYLLETYPHPNATLVIEKIRNKEKGSASFAALYNEGDLSSIEVILKAISHFPQDGDFERLPIFSERITGNPHYFDKNKRIYQAIEMIISEQENREYRSSLTAEDETNLLTQVYLDKDDLHSFVTVYGLEAYRDVDKVQQWHWANREGTVQNISLRSLRDVEVVKPVAGNKVFILENSGVYSSLLDKLEGVYPVVCTHGNLKLSGKLLLDKLVKGGATLYYSGDLDVKGIVIAKHLKNLYKEKIKIWRMGLEEYRTSISNVPISSIALERLIQKGFNEFNSVIEEMKKVKKAGYQEPLLQQFITDIKEHDNE
ncbi:DUF2399 domain-containing protein [Bacillus sp. sid0103]|uniref:TIGR02679 domain-containing protein n=1 Tax=Bacillus sp. sid0103 TaxID=2856337 RepID=UPI001C4454CD|nr:TIGR02679 domain-containing protein [Bacillus sp. sid0103]MBV7504810.1 DUF2399 domain-containing protein [Bacillus sp. sid0103]